MIFLASFECKKSHAITIRINNFQLFFMEDESVNHYYPLPAKSSHPPLEEAVILPFNKKFVIVHDVIFTLYCQIDQIIQPLVPTLQFFHQYLFLSLAALLSNCEAPACKASARSSSSDSFWSRSNTLSTFTRMMSTTWGPKAAWLQFCLTDRSTFTVCSPHQPAPGSAAVACCSSNSGPRPEGPLLLPRELLEHHLHLESTCSRNTEEPESSSSLNNWGLQIPLTAVLKHKHSFCLHLKKRVPNETFCLKKYVFNNIFNSIFLVERMRQ